MAIAAGTRLGPYKILSLLGRGRHGGAVPGAGPETRARGAIKLLPERLTNDCEDRTWFEREKRPRRIVRLRLLLTPSFAAGIEE